MPTERTRKALHDRLFVCGKRARFEGGVVICFLDLRCYVVWVPTHTKYLGNSVAHSTYHNQCRDEGSTPSSYIFCCSMLPSSMRATSFSEKKFLLQVWEFL